ncbi:Protein kinase incomplete domain containing protein [Pandoravirus celtis]|uniref:Protein kinase incomplete domain containing protein n=1 Tax=Pandoravirus celtis TaxID=2568002 RepID=A0A4D6EGC2_9VIRU|nr:Protein kinase incomplete domain containing protein [Pandoravirus celtis]
MQTVAPPRRERSRRRRPSEMSSSSSSSSSTSALSPQPSPRQHQQQSSQASPFPPLGPTMAATTQLGHARPQPPSGAMAAHGGHVRAQPMRPDRSSGRQAGGRHVYSCASNDDDDHHHRHDNNDDDMDSENDDGGDDNGEDDHDGGSAGSDVDKGDDPRRAVNQSRPPRDHNFAAPRAHRHRAHPHGRHHQQQHHQQAHPQRPTAYRQAQAHARGPRIIDCRRGTPDVHGPRPDSTGRGHPTTSLAATPTAATVDRRPRASATVPMLPLCETADDAQAVRALSGDKRYAVVRRLGSGASSSVFLACDRLRGDALVAIKVVSDAKVSRSEILAGTFLRGHRSIAAMIDWFSARDHYFLVFEHVDGPDLQVMWAGLPATRNFFAEEAFRHVFLCVLDAVAYCHAHGVVHRDIKMENVVVRDDGASACLVDFGFAFFVRPPHALLGAGTVEAGFGDTRATSAGIRAGGDAPDHRHRRAAVASAHQGYADVHAAQRKAMPMHRAPGARRCASTSATTGARLHLSAQPRRHAHGRAHGHARRARCQQRLCRHRGILRARTHAGRAGRARGSLCHRRLLVGGAAPRGPHRPVPAAARVCALSH